MEILGWSFAVECIVRPVVVVAVSKGIKEGLQPIEAIREVVGSIEFISPGAVAALDGAFELGSLGREDVEVELRRRRPSPAATGHCADIGQIPRIGNAAVKAVRYGLVNLIEPVILDQAAPFGRLLQRGDDLAFRQDVGADELA